MELGYLFIQKNIISVFILCMEMSKSYVTHSLELIVVKLWLITSIRESNIVLSSSRENAHRPTELFSIPNRTLWNLRDVLHLCC